MASVRSADTRPERTVRSALHRQGFRFRLHRRDLPGTPDLVFPKHRAVLFVHGCFWHGHDCHLFRWPRTRADFWRTKITANIDRDRRQITALRQAGWRVGTVWECALKGRERLPEDRVAEQCAEWLRSGEAGMEIQCGEAWNPA